jgi:NAD(P)-dependent dehydrogenase (short-subunit alcohol dehydrogenase family)
MAISLEGRVVIVTGAAMGLGMAMARGLLAAGASLVLTDVADAQLTNVRAELAQIAGADKLLTIAADVTSPQDAERVLGETLKRFGAVDALVNNAGIGPGIIRRNFLSDTLRFWECPPEAWRRILEVNAFGTFLMSRAVAPTMIARGAGRIISVSTTWETMLRPGFAGYGPSKAAIEAFSCAMERELAGTGVTVNTIIPGRPADTNQVPEDPSLVRSSLLRPEVMVAPVRWLCSAEAARVTGRRITAMNWDDQLPPAEALDQCSEPIAWPEKVTPVLLPPAHTTS